ncbi:MAG: ABC transporter substrate-binding protein [Dehalococcoidia bacterium]|nr:ABC transporter substrate-binding protein [Dehalococcoidia bacterium]
MKRLGKAMVLLGLAFLLVTASVVTACGGGGEKESNTVVLGWLADQTGASAATFREVTKGMDDYFAEMEETDPIPGVNIKMIVYDTRLDYARFPGGYQWLVGQGMDLLLGYSPETPDITLSDQVEDKIPQYEFSAWPTTMDEDWVYSHGYSQEYEGRAVLDYLVNQWWPTQGKDRALKVGHVGNPNWGSTGEYQKGLDWVAAQNPGKIELTSVGGSLTQTAWASEVAAIQDTDAIFLSTVGTSTATFLSEAIARGYKGLIVSSGISALPVWSMLRGMMDITKLDGLLVPHLYPLSSDATAYTDHMYQMLDKYRPSEAATLRKATTWTSGWVEAQMLAETVRLAAKNVGAENVDGTAINDAFKELDLEIQGMPNITLANSGSHHVLFPYCRMIKYDAAKDDWFAITDWFTAPGFAT